MSTGEHGLNDVLQVMHKGVTQTTVVLVTGRSFLK